MIVCMNVCVCALWHVNNYPVDSMVWFSNTYPLDNNAVHPWDIALDLMFPYLAANEITTF